MEEYQAEPVWYLEVRKGKRKEKQLKTLAKANTKGNNKIAGQIQNLFDLFLSASGGVGQRKWERNIKAM